MPKQIKRLEKLFWFYLILNPILDIVSGLFMFTKGDVYNSAGITPITPSLIVRMAMLLVMIAYILMIKDWKSVRIALPMGLAWLLSMMSERIVFGEVFLFIDIQYFARFAYNIAVFFVYCRLMERSGLSRSQVLGRIHRYVILSLFLLTIFIVIPYIFGAGHYTYADRFGYRGFRGFYYSGNDITGALMLLFPLGICYYLSIPQDKLTKKWGLFCSLSLAMTLLSLLMIGTKTAFLAIGIIFLGIMGYVFMAFSKKDSEPLRRCTRVLIIFALLFILISGLTTLVRGSGLLNTMSITLGGFRKGAGEGTNTLVFSGRLSKLFPAWQDYTGGGPISWLFGVGRGSQIETIEMDLCETLIYYGLFGFVAMLWLYLKEGVSFVRRSFKSFTVLSLGAFLSLGLCTAYLIIAGHVLFTVTSGFYFSFTLAYARYITLDELPPEKQLEKR